MVISWAAASDVELVFLPTNASWLNWIEPEFAALGYFALNGTGHRTHAEQGDAIARYLHWHSAEPKREFAPNSMIRTWTSYQNKVTDAAPERLRLGPPRLTLGFRIPDPKL